MSLAEDLITRAVEGTLVEDRRIVKLLWKKLGRSIDISQLGEFLDSIERGDSLNRAARNAGITVAKAADLLADIEKTGLL